MSTVKNVWSYFCFYIRYNRHLLVSIIVDILVLIWSLFNYDELFSSSSLLVVFIAVFCNIIWQSINLVSHFSFFKKNNPSEKILSNLFDSKRKEIVFSSITLEGLDHYERNDEWGFIENPRINAILRSPDSVIKSLYTPEKAAVTRRYIQHYNSDLFVFLNHKWHKSQSRKGSFTNDKKICLAGELNEDDNTWRICEGYYYNGYLTNSIFNKYLGGTAYPLFSPRNSLNSSIVQLQRSPFSDHIGISTLLITKDGYGIVLEQATNAGQYAGKIMPTGSGSMDYEDWNAEKNFKECITNAAMRELNEETGLFKSSNQAGFRVKTVVRGFYRDLERGGKPEFCCLSFVEARLTDIEIYITPNRDEMAEDIHVSYLVLNKEAWEQNVIPRASLSLKMCYREAVLYLNENPSADV